MRFRQLLPLLILILCSSAGWCSVLEQMTSDGSIAKVAAPDFTDPAKAREFAKRCQALSEELASSISSSPQTVELYKQALLASEFLTGRPYVLKTTQVPSVVKLREWVKSPVSDDAVAYVKSYPSKDAMPDIVSQVFVKPETRGMTLNGRYVAILETQYPQENADVLSHEMVHCYLSLASPKPLPEWFHEGAAVYFSTGKERKFYGREAGVAEGKETTLPEDYKNRLFVFNYIEEKSGKEKVYELVRKTVETGEVDMQTAGFGFASKKPKPEPAIPLKLLVIGGVGLVIVGVVIGVWVASRREDDF